MQKDSTPVGGFFTSTDLDKARRYYEFAVHHPAYTAWHADAKQAWAFYDGDHWTADEISKLQEYGQPPIVINKLASKVDNLAGSEVAGRTRILYRSRSGQQQEEDTARALSDLSLYIAERNNQALEISQVFRAGLVTGIGWLDIGIEADTQNGGQQTHIFNRCEDELRVIWDPSASRQDFSDARFVCRERWLDEDDIQQHFPAKAAEALSLLKQPQFGQHHYGQAPGIQYINANGDKLRVVEVQYKKSETQYMLSHPDGRTTTTFDAKFAKAHGGSVTSAFVPRVYVAYFTDNLLLSHQPLPYQHGGFSLVPYVFKRNRKDGRPYGMVKSAIDPQKELNKRRSKAMHLLNTAQVIADIDAVEDPYKLAREAARPDGMILKRPGKELKIIRNSDLAQSQVAVMDQAARDIQEVMGVFDESIGKQSNATSGLAIQQRQMAGTLNQMFAFDALRRTKRALGHQLLALMRQYFTAEMVIRITDDMAAPRQLHLNRTRQNAEGDTVMENDITLGTYDVYVEEVRDVMSSQELEIQQLNMLLAAGVPIPPHMLVEATSLRNKEALLAALGSDQQRQEAVPPNTNEI